VTELSRRERIVLLAGSLEDYLPGPWLGRSELSGEGPSERVECSKCDGLGRVRVRNRIEPCSRCGSAGVVDVDAYTGRVLAKVPKDPKERFALRPGEIRETMEAEKADWESRKRYRERKRRLYAELDGEREGEDFVDWVLRRRRVLYRAGDYERLLRHLNFLADSQGLHGQMLASAFWIVYGPSSAFRHPGPRIRARAEAALDWLETVMPRVPRVPEWLLAPVSRDDAILALARKRTTQGEIAKQVGVSPATVSRVLARLVPA
jgi:hypothetical protein